MTGFRLGLTRPQAVIYRDTSRYRVVAAGRRFGKTVLSIVELLRAASANPHRPSWYVAPTYGQAKTNVWEFMKASIDRSWIAEISESDLWIRLANGAQIRLFGADRPHRLRGPIVSPGFVVLDEARWIKEELWQSVVQPMLADSGGRALFISSPEGFNWFYDLFERGQNPDDRSWRSWQYTTKQGGWIPDEELENARAMMDPRIYRQEYLASFEALGNRVYSPFDRHAHLRDDLRDPGGSLLIGMDFNVNPMAFCIATKAGDECHVLEAHEIQTSHTLEVAQYLRSKYPDRHLVACPDPSARRRSTNAPGGVTDFTILRDHQIEVWAPNTAPAIVDRVNNVNANLEDANGDRHVYLQAGTCRPLVRALEGLTYKDDTNLVDKTSGLDHSADAFGYLLWTAFRRLHGRSSATHF